MEWREHGGDGDGQLQRREGVLLYMDESVDEGDCVFTLFVVPGAGLMFFSSLSVAESVLRNTSANVTGWSGIRACVPKPPKSSARLSSAAMMVDVSSSTTSSSSDSDHTVAVTVSPNGKTVAATATTRAVPAPQKRRRKVKETDTAWLERRLARHARKEHQARLRRLYEEQREQEEHELQQLVQAGGRREDYFTLHAYRVVMGGPGFTNAAWMGAYRTALLAKVEECTTTTTRTPESTTQQAQEKRPPPHTLSPLSCPSFL